MEEGHRETAQGALGVGARLNGHDQRIKELGKKVARLEQRADTDIGEAELVGKRIKIALANGDDYTGSVVAVSKFRIKLKLEAKGSLSDGKERTFNKGHIVWHQEL